MSSKADSQRKKQRAEFDSPLSSTWFDSATAKSLRAEHDESAPYRHVVLQDLCTDERARNIHNEITINMKANFKETDLFKVFQTGDLAALTAEEEAQMPHLMSLRKAIYSNEFREFVTEITGCGDLTDRVDCSCNAYAHSCHLLCHDDVIGTRRVSYIIYLSDPDDPWRDIDGGAVELYPLEPDSVVEMNGQGVLNDNRQGIPESVPTRCLLPTFNTMLIFAVQPGRSYHSVQEVFSTSKPRLSISGWYHAASPPAGSDKSSLQQIMTLGDDHRLFSNFSGRASAELALTKAELKELSRWINPNYLAPDALKDINEQFCANSSLQLNDFIRSDLAFELTKALITADETQNIGHNVPQLDYTVGASANWQLVGPPHKRRHLLFDSRDDGKVIKKDTSTSDAVGAQLDAIRKELFRSAVFAKYLHVLTELQPLGYKDEVRRFRAGLDYTVAHYGVLTKKPRLDATLCFVNDNKSLMESVLAKSAAIESSKKSSSSTTANDDEEEENDDDDYEEMWDGGEVGGFECYIEAEEDPENAEAAEVYRTSYNRDNQNVGGAVTKKDNEGSDSEEEDNSTSLLSVSACNNTLNLVMRDEGVMRFVKYVSSAAPGSRWDIAVEYEIAEQESSDDEDDEEGDEDE